MPMYLFCIGAGSCIFAHSVIESWLRHVYDIRTCKVVWAYVGKLLYILPFVYYSIPNFLVSLENKRLFR